ncbi:MAG: hypothetical protein EZS28_030511, partial [Streblomastix strix]
NKASSVWNRYLGDHIQSRYLITMAVPPNLPANMSSGISYGLTRLKDRKILQFVSLRRSPDEVIQISDWGINSLSGLSEQDLLNNFSDRWKSFASQSYSYDGRSELTLNVTGSENEIMSLFLSGLTSCHSFGYINQKFVGDPLDVVMLKFTEQKFKDMENN